LSSVLFSLLYFVFTDIVLYFSVLVYFIVFISLGLLSFVKRYCCGSVISLVIIPFYVNFINMGITNGAKYVLNCFLRFVCTSFFFCGVVAGVFSEKLDRHKLK
jgi:hypothetical protein